MKLKTSENAIIGKIPRNVLQLGEKAYGLVSYSLPFGYALPPLSAVLLLTYGCNLRCRMCFYYNSAQKEKTQSSINKRRREELSLEEIKNFVDDFAKMGGKSLSLHGGEPLLHPNILDITKYSRGKGLMVNLVTNGTLLNESLAKGLVEAGVNHMSFSIDGTESIHDRIRNSKGAYRKCMLGILNLKKISAEHGKGPSISVNTTISSENADQIKVLADIIGELNVKEWSISPITRTSESGITKTVHLLDSLETEESVGCLKDTSKDLDDIDTGLVFAQKGYLKRFKKGLPMRILFPTDKGISNLNSEDQNEKETCFYPWTRTVVSPYGEVFSCVNFGTVGYSIGNIDKDSLSKIWNNDKYRAFRSNLKKAGHFPICNKCCSLNYGESL